MATTNLYLKGKMNKNGKYPIILVYQDKGRKFNYQTKFEVEKTKWDGNRIIGKSLEVLEINTALQDLENIICDIHKEALRNKKYYGIDVVEQKFRLQLNISQQGSEFVSLFNQFIEISRSRKSISTIKSYQTTIKQLEEFSKRKRVDLTFENINMNFYYRFLNYLIDLGHVNNTVGKSVKVLKTFLNYVRNNELTNINFNVSGFKVFKEDIDIIALTEKELWSIYNLKDLPQTLEYVKDYFCFECFTGLRFSDIAKLENENVKSDFIELRTKKTRDSLFVPLNSFAKKIIEKYKGQFIDRPIPPTLTNQKSNNYIKDIAELAGITDVLIIEKFSGSNQIIIKKPKCDFITTHTGRKTFITLSHERGMPIEMIMKITGIKNWTTMKKYLKISEKAKLIQMNEFWNDKKLNLAN